jgi:hypothetical protein
MSVFINGKLAELTLVFPDIQSTVLAAGTYTYIYPPNVQTCGKLASSTEPSSGANCWVNIYGVWKLATIS